jgi:hypothetical protein
MCDIIPRLVCAALESAKLEPPGVVLESAPDGSVPVWGGVIVPDKLCWLLALPAHLEHEERQ